VIVIKLVGGLGNQMFEYAAAKGLAAKLGTDVQMDRSWFGQIALEDTPRHYELDSFKLSQDFVDFKPFFAGTNLLSRGIVLVAHVFGRKVLNLYLEPHYHYNADFSKQPDSTYLDGYFQSEKYFVHIREDLLSDFSWAKPAAGKNKKLLEVITKDENSVSIHVRRGDYVSNENAAEFHGLRGIGYYQAAVKIIEKSVKKPNYYVFSDEPDWCKVNLKFKHNTTYIDWNADGAEDMRLMKSCRHNVLANSSFSWWGAWLNANEDKIVVAPRQWFNDPTINTDDVVPESWRRI
jgi:hypothetical protein